VNPIQFPSLVHYQLRPEFFRCSCDGFSPLSAIYRSAFLCTCTRRNNVIDGRNNIMVIAAWSRLDHWLPQTWPPLWPFYSLLQHGIGAAYWVHR
jgi:hypothetical protein